MSSVVRNSKFRHVHGSSGNKEVWYENLNCAPSATPDSNLVACNTKYLAVAWRGGGGPFVVHPMACTGKMSSTPKMFQGHSGPVQDLDFSPFYDEVIASVSEDASVKVWNFKDKLTPEAPMAEDVGEECATTLSGHSKKVTLVRWHPTASHVLVTSSFDNTLRLWDANKGAESFKTATVPDAIQHISWNYDGSNVAVSSKDKFVRVLDPRTDTVAVEFEAHTGAKGCRVCYLGTTHMLATTGFSRQSDRQLFVWDVRGTDKGKAVVEHLVDTASGSLMPFYDSDVNMLYLAGKGDGNVRYYEIVEGPPYIHYVDQYSGKDPQRGLGMVPKRGVDTAGTEIAKFMRLCDKHIEPLSFKVPRKSETGNDDLYPPTFSGRPSLSADEWLGGKNADPILDAISAPPPNLTAPSPPTPSAAAAPNPTPPPTPADPPPSATPSPAPAPPTPTPAPTSTVSTPAKTEAVSVAVTLTGTGPGGVTLSGSLNVFVPDADAQINALQFRVAELEAENKALKEQLAAK